MLEHNSIWHEPVSVLVGKNEENNGRLHEYSTIINYRAHEWLAIITLTMGWIELHTFLHGCQIKHQTWNVLCSAQYSFHKTKVTAFKRIKTIWSINI